MRSTDPGLYGYMYEFLLYRSMQEVSERAGSAVTVTQGRQLRAEIDAALGEIGLQGSLDSETGRFVTASTGTVLTAINEVVARHYTGIAPLFPTASQDDRLFAAARDEFLSMTGTERPVGNEAGDWRVSPDDGRDRRLPLTPYDPRWSGHQGVVSQGAGLSYILTRDVMEAAPAGPTEGSLDLTRLNRSQAYGLFLYGDNHDGSGLNAVGSLNELDSISGLGRIALYMTPKELVAARPHVLAASNNGANPEEFMSTAAVDRAVAILEELQAQGVEYSIVPDRNPGQLKALLRDSGGLEVRLMDIAKDEAMVGRTYNDGAYIYYTLRRAVALRDKKVLDYVPSPQDAVNMMRLAQNIPVERTDGQGFVGVPDVVPGAADVYYLKGSADQFDPTLIRPRKIMSAVVGPWEGDPTNEVIARTVFERRVEPRRPFASEDGALGFLLESVQSARDNVMALVGVDNLVAELEANKQRALVGLYDPEVDGEPYFPEFDPNAEIAAIQRSYWDVLRGAQDTLLRPGAEREDYEDRVAVMAEMALTDEARGNMHDLLAGEVAYTGTPLERVRAHAQDLPNHFIGSALPRQEVDELTGEPVLRSFDAGRVAAHMTSEMGPWRNTTDLISAMRTLGWDGSTLRGGEFYSSVVVDRLIEFDETSATSLEDLPEGFVKRMAQEVKDSVSRQGVRKVEVSVDAQGIARWSGARVIGEKDPQEQAVTGEIGQFFEPGEHGEIVTRYNGGQNYMFVPGYEARVVAQKPGENLSLEERTRLRGLEQIMAERVRSTIRADLYSAQANLGEPASINPGYRRLHDSRHEVDFLERAAEEGMRVSMAEAILRTEGQRVSYSTTFTEESTLDAVYRESQRPADEKADGGRSAWLLSGKRNMAILAAESSGYFDLDATASGKRAGTVRYLTDSAVVNPDGSITKGIEGDMTSLLKEPELALSEFNPPDRRQMTFTNVMQAAAVTEPVGLAMTTVGGWTTDDGLVISQEFAKGHQVRGANGELRDLIIGDKLSDLHGNKGVISLIVNRDLPQFDPENIDPQVTALFAANPELDVVMSPFSPVSRFNGGSARELMQDASDLHLANGEVVPGGMGKQHIIVTHKLSDKGSIIYDGVGEGRRFGGQTAWALNAQDATKVQSEFFTGNTGGFVATKELLITTGVYLGSDGEMSLLDAFSDMDNPRRVFEISQEAVEGSAAVQEREFALTLGRAGGYLALPFPIDLPSGVSTPVYESDPETGEAELWKLPVMSSSLRVGQARPDGSETAHDYTQRYRTIYRKAAAFYRHEAQAFAAEDKGDRVAAGKARAKMAEVRGEATMAYNAIANDVTSRHFSGKYNAIKEKIMATRVPHSATAVWSADPRLDLDQVGMSSLMAAQLGFAEGDHALIWRDPILRDGGVRYLRIKLDERLTGVSIHPAMSKSFDGDFDGDSVAVVRLTTPGAIEEATQKLSVPANLLDAGSKGEDGLLNLSIHNSLDMKVIQHTHPEITARLEELRVVANELQADRDSGELDQEGFYENGKILTEELTELYHTAFGMEHGNATLRFGSARDHLISVKEACVDTGAKGSLKAMNGYGRYFGAVTEWDKNGKLESFTEVGAPMVTQAEREETQLASAVKGFGTGLAGGVSQKVMRLVRNLAPKAATEAGQPPTQGVLQSKHKAAEAWRKYTMLRGPLRSLWNGLKMREIAEADGSKSWEPVRDKNGNNRQATAPEWVSQYMATHTHEDGLNVSVNQDHAEVLSRVLSVDGVMVDLSDDEAVKAAGLMTPMDEMGYGGTFETVVSLAKEHANLFEGRYNQLFAPGVVRANMAALEDPSKELREVTAPDVVEGRAIIAKQKRSAFAERVRAPRAAIAAQTAVVSERAAGSAPRESAPGVDYSL